MAAPFQLINIGGPPPTSTHFITLNKTARQSPSKRFFNGKLLDLAFFQLLFPQFFSVFPRLSQPQYSPHH